MAGSGPDSSSWRWPKRGEPGGGRCLPPRAVGAPHGWAVRIPAEFRLDTDRVSISRNESGDLLIHPLRAELGAALLDALRAVGEADPAFIAALEAEQACQQPLQE